MADADIARASISKAQDGFSVQVVLRRGEQIDMRRVNFVGSFDEAENIVKAFAKQHNLPWHNVEVISPWLGPQRLIRAAGCSRTVQTVGEGIQDAAPSPSRQLWPWVSRPSRVPSHYLKLLGSRLRFGHYTPPKCQGEVGVHELRTNRAGDLQQVGSRIQSHPCRERGRSYT
jgi:hypothetical protein